MKLTLAETKLFADSISVISELVNEATFKIKKTGMELIAMDPANVAMISFNILGPAFTEYELEKEKNITINLDNLKQIIKRAKPSDTVNFQLDEEKNKLKIKIFGASTRTFRLALIERPDKAQKVPDLNFKSHITTNTELFDEAIEDMSVISESVAFEATKNKFKISSSSKLNAAKVEIPAEKNTTIKLEGNEIQSKYSLEYLKKIIKASKLTKDLEIRFDNDYPLRLDYNIKDKLALSFILAPRVSND